MYIIITISIFIDGPFLTDPLVLIFTVKGADLSFTIPFWAERPF